MPWYNGNINVERRLRRKHERKWLKSGTENDRLAYQTQRDKVHQMIDASKTEFYRSSLANSNKKDVFKILYLKSHENGILSK